MQPMVSPIDHESRHNSYRTDDEQGIPSENTPLLQRFPQPEVIEAISSINKVIVSLLLIILIFGVVIGIYLLVIQNNSENVLPPVDTPLQLVSRAQWDPSGKSLPESASSSFKASRVIVMQTDTQQCYSSPSCAALLRDMQANATFLPYNFLVSSTGQTYEALGWRRPSPLFPQYSATALVLALIGNFTEVPPTRAQIDEAKNFFTESVSLQHLEESFVVIGKSTKELPKYLFRSLKDLPQWDSKLSDM